jgi:hypothetical protein
MWSDFIIPRVIESAVLKSEDNHFMFWLYLISWKKPGNKHAIKET